MDASSISCSVSDCSSSSFNSSHAGDYSTINSSHPGDSTTFNSSHQGDLGTRGLSKKSSRQRRQLLKQAGVTKFDSSEGEELKKIRESRISSNCGCDCVGACLSESCICVQNGITCHEEQKGEPCACSQGLCNNPIGRYRFDPTQVKMHFAEVKMGIVSLD